MNISIKKSSFKKNFIRAAVLLMALIVTLAFPVGVSAAGFQEAVPAVSTTYNLPDNTVTASAAEVTYKAVDLNSADDLSTFGNYGVASAAMLSTTVNSDIDMDTLFGGIVDIIIKMASYVGMILVIGGIFSLILAYKDDNADAQSKAIRYIVVGASLMGLRVFLSMAGIIV